MIVSSTISLVKFASSTRFASTVIIIARLKGEKRNGLGLLFSAESVGVSVHHQSDLMEANYVGLVAYGYVD